MSTTASFDAFLSLSVAITAFDRVTLVGTGQAEAYYATAVRIAGAARMEAIAQTWLALGADSLDPDDLRAGLRKRLFGDPELGPVVRNILKMWYTGSWYQLPSAWREAYGAHPDDVTFVISAASYPEGLLWPAIGANPHGAKAPGYGTWATPPRIPDYSDEAII